MGGSSNTERRARWQRTRTLPSAAVRSGDVTAIRRVSARNDLVETSRHHPLGQYLGPMATFDLNIELAQRGVHDAAALRNQKGRFAAISRARWSPISGLCAETSSLGRL